jgi:hypothetical protein
VDPLKNELIVKYFGCVLHETGSRYDCEWIMSSKILRAMQEPIRKGERYIYSNGNGDWFEKVAEEGIPYQQCFVARLPDAHQKREQTVLVTCPDCHLTYSHEHMFTQPPAPEKPPTKEEVKRDYHICDCEFCGHPDTIHIPAKSTAVERKVEEKIKEIKANHSSYSSAGWDWILNELVAIVRGEK